MQLTGAKVLVVGLGKSGVSAARLLMRRGARVIANDARGPAELPPEVLQLQDTGAQLALSGHDPALFASVDRIVLSPGVPELPALEAAARAGVPIMSEVELAARFIEAKVIGITGTNGKSTVTSLCAEMCKNSGRPTFAGGNLGTPLSDVVDTPAASHKGFVVVELSSFQLERIDELRVHVAALLNITADHLDRYPSFDAYAEAKRNIFRNQTGEDFAVVQSGDTLCAALARAGEARLYTYGGGDGAVRVEGGAIVDGATSMSVPLAEVGLSGRLNHENACAAALLARLAGVDKASIERALREFKGLPHRMVHVRTLDGVDYFDDSKATNVGATVAALDSLTGRSGRVLLIAGGRDKGGEYVPIAERMRTQGRAALLIGEAAPLIDSALQGTGVAIEKLASLEQAVSRARELAQPGDAVLLAPACSSFDMFRSYAHRGDVFQDAVRALKGGG